LLIGRAGVGKTRLFNSLSPDCVSGNGFQTIKLNDFVVVDTPSLELDEEIELREERIS
jgi:ethanolamine utilization protein EutP (predicted NTPase)